MKKFFYIGFVLILSACSKDFVPGVENDGLRTEHLRARIVQTKANVSDAGKFSWTEGDEIAVHRSASGYETARLTADGNFNVHLADGEERDGYAVYPASVVSDAAGLSVTLPAAYTIPKTGMGDYSPLPMIAVNDPASEDISFRHLGGIIRLVLDRVPFETQKIVVNLGKKVTGEFAVENPGSDSPSISLTEGAAEDIVFTLESPVTTYADHFVLNIPVPLGLYENISLQIFDRYGNFVLDQSEDVYFSVERTDGYELGSDLTVDVTTIPLCIQMARAGVLKVSNPIGLVMEYSYDNETWESFNSSKDFNLAKGDRVYFRGENAAYSQDDGIDLDAHRVSISTSVKSYVFGNIMSLINPDPAVFSQLKEFTEPNVFTGLFANSDIAQLLITALFSAFDAIGSHPSLDLILPATTLTPHCYHGMFMATNMSRMVLPATEMKESCYESMFAGCIKMTEAPALPAVVLAPHCYEDMLSTCKSLTKAPELPVTELADHCYDGMLQNGTALVEAPALPATEMKEGCYAYMFRGCSSLLQAPELSATELAPYCYQRMFCECTALTIPPELPATGLAPYCYWSMFRDSGLEMAPEDLLPATTAADYCYSSMFEGCKNLTSAPALPATTLSQYCYSSMFSGCASLRTAPVLPAEVLADYCYQNMFYGCSSIRYLKAMFKSSMLYSVSDAVSSWLSGVSETGTYVMNDAAQYDPYMDAGVPSGWYIDRVIE